VAKELTQPEQRRPRTFYDQHDRTWETVIDIRTGHAAGPWEPKFQAPWYPEAKYIRHDPSDDRRILIDYDRNVRDAKRAMDDYDDLRMKVAMDQYGSAFTSKLGETHEDDPPELKKLVGGPPFPVAFPEAALEGNRWVLGFSTTIPKWAYAFVAAQNKVERKYLDADEEVERAVDLDETHDPEATGGKRVKVKRKPTEYNAFVAQHKGLPLAEIGRLWREQKQAASAA